jgi:putative transposase
MLFVKLTVQAQLFPAKTDADKLRQTVERFNEAARWLADEAFRLQVANKIELQKTHYRPLRERFNLSAQMAVRCIAQVCECYKRDKSKRPRFRKHAAMPFDYRMMSFKGIDRVSLLTLDGRVVVPMVMGAYQRERFGGKKGQCDLVLRRDGKWFLLCTVDLPDGTPTPATDFVGVDLGISQIARTSDGESFSGDKIEQVRQKYHRIRRSLGRKMYQRHKRRTRKNARRAMKRLGSRESRFRRDLNHVISKKLVALCKDTGRGLALEDLKGIRDRARFRKGQRAKMSGWAFFQLRSFLEYKGKLHGVPVVKVDPRNTSRTCAVCGHCEKANRSSQSVFKCRSCGYEANADTNAARNIRARALVNALQVSEPPQIAA